MCVCRIQRGWQPLRQAIDYKRQYKLTDQEAQSMIYRAFMAERFPVKLLKAVHQEFFIAPSYETFWEKTVWSLGNAFTTSFKKLAPVQQYQVTAKLGRFLKPYTQTF